jgi:hypothetical protein
MLRNILFRLRGTLMALDNRLMIYEQELCDIRFSTNRPVKAVPLLVMQTLMGRGSI